MKSITEQLEERLPSVEAAYQETGRPKVDFSVYPEDMREHKEASYHANVLVEAARKIEKENDPAELNWKKSQPKWIPWFDMSAFAFVDPHDGRSNASPGGGSRLRTLTEEASTYLGETFPEIWEAVQLK